MDVNAPRRAPQGLLDSVEYMRYVNFCNVSSGNDDFYVVRRTSRVFTLKKIDKSSEFNY